MKEYHKRRQMACVANGKEFPYLIMGEYEKNCKKLDIP